MQPLCILGIDPGSRITGYGVIEARGAHFAHVASGTLKLKAAEFSERLAYLFQALADLIRIHTPSAMALEAVFLAKNAASALKLGQARGAILTVAGMHQLPVYEYAARQVKRMVTGYGGADKSAVQQMVLRQLQADLHLTADASDALALAMTHGIFHATILRFSDSMHPMRAITGSRVRG